MTRLVCPVAAAFLWAVASLSTVAAEQETVNVRETGAVGNGVADDTAAIQRALDGGRRTVVIPAGKYKITQVPAKNRLTVPPSPPC